MRVITVALFGYACQVGNVGQLEVVNIARKNKKAGMLVKERLKYARERLGLSQVKLAEVSGVGLRVIVKREHQSGGVTSDTLVALANVLEVSTDWLTGRVDESELRGHAQRQLGPEENSLLVAFRDWDLKAAADLFARRGAALAAEAFGQRGKHERGEQP